MSSKHLFKGVLILLELTSQQAFCHTRVFCLQRPSPSLLLQKQIYNGHCKRNHFCKSIYRVAQAGQLEVSDEEVRLYDYPSLTQQRDGQEREPAPQGQAGAQEWRQKASLRTD